MTKTISVRGDLGSLVADVRTPSSSGPHPVIVCCAGMTLTRDVWVPPLAERFVAAGFATINFDYATFGDSDGQPRCRLNMPQQVRDTQAVMRWCRTQSDLDTDRLGLFGVSLGASVAVATGPTEGVRAVVAAAGPMDLGRVWRRFDGFAAFQAKVAEARAHFHATGEARTIALTRLLSSDPETCAKIDADAPNHPRWRPEVSFESLLDLFAFVPEDSAPHLPPSLFVAPEHDALIAGEELPSAASKAPHGALLLLKGAKHVDVYAEGAPAFTELSQAAIAHFRAHLT